MKKQSLKKHAALIITMVLFSMLPQFVAAQNGNGKCKKIFCPPGYTCVNGYCKGRYLADSSSVREQVSVIPGGTTTTSIQPKCKEGNCPPLYFCYNGICKKYVWHFTDSLSAVGSVSATNAQKLY